MTYFSSYQAGVYGDLYQNFMPPPVQRLDGSIGAPTAIELFGSDLFSPELLTKMGYANNPQSSGLGMGGGGSFNSQYSAMWAAKMDQPMITYDSEGKATQGASWNQFEYGLRNGKGGNV